MTIHVVQFSTGIGSAEVARRLVEEHGADSVHLLTADTLVEDADNWRFAREVVEYLGRPQWDAMADGRTPMQAGRDARVVPNNRLAVCSRVLKRDLLRKHIEATYDPAETVIHLGFDWTEPHRFKAAQPLWEPWVVDAILTRPPYTHKSKLLDEWRARGIKPPRLYAQGFSHANCFAGETRFITQDGVRSLKDSVGERLKVLGKGGGWKDAEVKSFGRQELLRIEFQRYGDTKIVEATAAHLWPVRRQPGRTDFTLRPTTDLQSGHRIAGMYGHVRHNVTPSAVGIMAGFTFGDGTACRPASGQTTAARAFLVGDKDEALLPYFASCRKVTRTDGVIEVRDLPRSWKMFPDLSESQSYLYGWLAGYFAADGTVVHGSARLASARREHLEFVRDLCARIGIATMPIRECWRRGYGSVDTPLYTVALAMSTLREDFFLIAEHRRRFLTRADKTPRPADWQVVGVTRTGHVDEVYCCVVEDGHMFTLEDNLHTSNCGGACVRGGQAQWRLLLATNRSRYLEWEGEEEQTRDMLGKDVSILRDRTAGATVPLTLRRFREQVDQDESLFDADDWGACGCFMDEGSA